MRDGAETHEIPPNPRHHDVTRRSRSKHTRASNPVRTAPYRNPAGQTFRMMPIPPVSALCATIRRFSSRDQRRRVRVPRRPAIEQLHRVHLSVVDTYITLTNPPTLRPMARSSQGRDGKTLTRAVAKPSIQSHSRGTVRRSETSQTPRHAGGQVRLKSWGSLSSERRPTLGCTVTARNTSTHPCEPLPATRQPHHFALLAPETVPGKPNIPRKEKNLALCAGSGLVLTPTTSDFRSHHREFHADMH